MSTMINTKDSTIDVEELKRRIRERVERIRTNPDFVPVEKFEFEQQDASETQQGAPSRIESPNFGSRSIELVVEQRNLATDKKIITSIIMKLHKMADQEIRWLLEPTFARVTEAVNSLLASVDSLRTTQDSLRTTQDSLRTTQDSLRTTQASEIERVNGLLADVNYLKRALEWHEECVAVEERTMERMHAEINRLKSRTDSLEGRLSKQTAH